MTPPHGDPLDPMDGEVGRALIRIEASMDALRVELRERSHLLKNDMTMLIKPISTLEAQAANTDKQLESMAKTMEHVTQNLRAVELRSAAISGGVAVGAWLLHLIWAK